MIVGVATLAQSGVGGVAASVSPPAEAIYGNWDGVDFGPAASGFVTVLGGNGYASVRRNISAVTSMGAGHAQDDAIWAMYGHADAGVITMSVGGTGSALWASKNTINRTGVTCSSANSTCLSVQNASLMRDIRFMLFAGCHTALARNGDSLQSVASSLGIDSSIGFGDFIYPSAGPFLLWNTTFFTETAKNGKTLVNAALAAEDAVWAKYGYYDNTDESFIYGGSIKLKPAAYGSN